ncbi:unnamed protein product [Fusarium graminearum]|nr:unnamed protein product [Fusarium graminearum]
MPNELQTTIWALVIPARVHRADIDDMSSYPGALAIALHALPAAFSVCCVSRAVALSLCRQLKLPDRHTASRRHDSFIPYTYFNKLTVPARIHHCRYSPYDSEPPSHRILIKRTPVAFRVSSLTRAVAQVIWKKLPQPHPISADTFNLSKMPYTYFDPTADMVMLETAGRRFGDHFDISIVRNFRHIIINLAKIPYSQLPANINLTRTATDEPITVYLLIPIPQPRGLPYQGGFRPKYASCLNVHPVSTDLDQDAPAFFSRDYADVSAWMDRMSLAFGDDHLPQLALAQIGSNCPCGNHGPRPRRPVGDVKAYMHILRSGRVY